MEPTETNKTPPEEQGFRASDVRDAAGLSYRQLNDWDSKGAVPGQREGEAGWRRFSAREVFALMVCAEIRKRFGVPVESLRFVRSFMLQDQADHLRSAIELKALGLSVWLLTDLHETFVMDTDLEFTDLLSAGYLRIDNPQAFVFLNLNPLVNRMLTALKKPIQLSVRHESYEAFDGLRTLSQAQTNEELEVLRLLRVRDYSRVIVERRNGDIVGVSAEQEFIREGRTVTDEELKAIIRSRDFQTVTLKKHNGKLVRLTQTVQLGTTKAEKASPSKGATTTIRRDTDRRGKRPKPKTS